MKHIIVTGGAGFIGSHLCEALVKKGYRVTALDNLCTGRKENLSSLIGHADFQWVEGDVCTPGIFERCPFLKSDGLMGLFHFACPASPVDFEKIPRAILGVDSIGTLATAELALQYGARYVLASTSEVYGDPEVHPQTENYFGNVNTTGPRACYDEAKRFSEAVVTSAARGWEGHDKKLDARIVRIFNTYGPRMRLDDGRAIPEFFRCAFRGEPMVLHGKGQQTRSFCYVSDLVDGVLRLFESDCEGPVNIGNPSEIPISELAAAILKMTGATSSIQFVAARDDDPRRRCPDITRAKTELKWAPKMDLAQGLLRTMEFFRSEAQRT